MDKKIKLSPSIIASNNYKSLDEAKKTLELLNKCKLDMIHLDVMDGKFVPAKTFDFNYILELRDRTDFLLDVHLMVENPMADIDKYMEAGADIITVHYEAVKSAREMVELLKIIKSNGILTGVAISPETPERVLFPFLKENLIDVVLIMSVHPGACGQKFMPEVIEKVARISRLFPKVDIAVDGGMNEETAKLVASKGANIIVAGSSVFGSADIVATIKNLKAIRYHR